jgi:hypothetical protein
VLPGQNETNIGTKENENEDLGARLGILSMLVVLCVLIIIARVYFGRNGMASADDRTLPDEDDDLSDEEKDLEDCNQSAMVDDDDNDDDSPSDQTNNPTIHPVRVDEEGSP